MSNPTPILNMSKIYDHSRHGWTLSKVPSSSTDPAGSSRSFPAIPASSAVYRPRCLQVRFLSKTTIPVWNALPWSWRPSHWRRSSCVCSLSSHHDMCTYCTNCFSSFVPVWVHLCTASALHVPPPLFKITRLWCTVLWHPFEVILLLVENEQQCTIWFILQCYRQPNIVKTHSTMLAIAPPSPRNGWFCANCAS